jgi:hypothetical protein
MLYLQEELFLFKLLLAAKYSCYRQLCYPALSHEGAGWRKVFYPSIVSYCCICALIVSM